MLQDITTSILAMALQCQRLAVKWFAGWWSRLLNGDCLRFERKWLCIQVPQVCLGCCCLRPCWLDTVCLLDGWNEGQVIIGHAVSFWTYNTPLQNKQSDSSHCSEEFRAIQVDTRALVFGEGQLSMLIQNVAACSYRITMGPTYCPAVHR
jgi:hypothetical protein